MPIQTQIFKLKYLRLGKAKAGTKRTPSSIESACKTDSVSEKPAKSDRQTDSISLTSSRWDEFCEKFDQWPRVPNNSSTALDPAIRTMHINNILYHMVKLQEHHWMLLEQHDKDKCSNKREFPCAREVFRSGWC
jgi:hypothetical protein